MPRPTTVLPGQKYGRLLVMSQSTLRVRYFLCQCDCGTQHEVFTSHLRNGKIQSCGCLRKETAARVTTERQTKHGMFGSRIYGIWNSMMDRCSNTKNRAYHRYGGRGIKVDPRWTQFENFYADMGAPEKGQSIERKNNDLGYSKANCIWASSKQQANNRSTCLLLTHNGKTQSASLWAAELEIKRTVIYDRIHAGWSDAKTLTTPIRTKK